MCHITLVGTLQILLPLNRNRIASQVHIISGFDFAQSPFKDTLASHFDEIVDNWRNSHRSTDIRMALETLKLIPLPTIDRPFGIELWPLFDKAFTSVTGFSPVDFHFVQGQTPMSTLKETVAVLLSYYIIIFGGRELMRNQPALQLKGLFVVHNLYLTVISGVLLALFIEQLLPTVWRHGVFFAICNHKGGWTKPLVTLYYVSSPLRSSNFSPEPARCSQFQA